MSLTWFCRHGLTAAAALEYPAIQLFVERAADVLGGFRLRDADVPTAIDICRKLDGMPLAIELAAASIAALGLQGLASSVDHPLGLPTSGSRTAPPRHRTLRAVLDWSCRLLSEEERKMFRRLGLKLLPRPINHRVFIDAKRTTAAEELHRALPKLTNAYYGVRSETTKLFVRGQTKHTRRLKHRAAGERRCVHGT
jgi:hypothetical protein